MNNQQSPSQTITIENEERIYDEAKLQALKEAPVIHEWSVIAPPFPLHVLATAIPCTIPILSGIALSISEQTISYFLVFLIMGIALGCFARYFFISDKLYHYQLTPLGVHFTIQDVIPDAAYTVVRVIAWGGVVLCLVAVVELGVLAFAGAGGMALMAIQMTSFSKHVHKESTLFADNNEIRILRKHHFFSIRTAADSILDICNIYCKEGELDDTLTKFLPYLKNHTIQDITSCRDI